ncbi:MAG: hypothetical protein VXZ63_02200 [Planctomycetota bacterium]|nr:hypothetical protein [Planctomycetota bacterium]
MRLLARAQALAFFMPGLKPLTFMINPLRQSCPHVDQVRSAGWSLELEDGNTEF